ncbi:hypothetical protein [Parafannyhessea umbonata]|uniref:hypothetical protein n=1 Tax=Parafannyhessea umbonata TaxID=604330 RepID=UPI00359C49CD
MQRKTTDDARQQGICKDSGREGRAHAAAARRRDARGARQRPDQPNDDPFIRAEREDDDGYDPYSDRRPTPEPLFERDPWD